MWSVFFIQTIVPYMYGTHQRFLARPPFARFFGALRLTARFLPPAAGLEGGRMTL